MLKDAGADRPERHCSLKATVEWTLSLLDDGPRTLFIRGRLCWPLTCCSRQEPT